MAFPGSEEVGFKRIALSASDYNANVPIKKRKFPLIQSPPSPSPSPSPSKVIFSPPLDGNLIRKEQPCLSDGPTISNSSTVTVSFSDESERKSDSRNANMVPSNIGPSRVRFQEDDACFNGYVEYEEKSVVNEKHAFHVLPEKPELKLSPIDPSPTPKPCADNRSDEIDGKKREKECKSSISLVKVKVESSIGMKEHLVTDVVPEGGDWKCHKPNNLEPVSLDLSLSKKESGTPCVTGNVGCNHDDSLLQSNRENWDLNTSMESWEDSASDAPAVQIAVTQTNTIVTTHRCSTEMVETDTPVVKQILLGSNDHLHLSLSSSDLKPVASQEKNSSVKLDLGKTNHNLISPNGDMQFANLNVVKKFVKPEPFVEGSKLDFEGIKVGLGFSDNAIVKGEFSDKCNLQAPNSLDICSPIEIMKPKSIKSEGVDREQEALKTSGGTLDQAAKQVLREFDSSCPIAMPVMEVMTGAPSHATDTTISRETSILSEQLTPIKEHLNMKVQQEGSSGGGLVNSEMINISKDPGSKDFSISALKTSSAEDEIPNIPKWCPSKVMNDQCSGLQGGEESSVSDEEKVSISADMLEDDSYGSEYESDGNQDVAKTVDAVDNDIEEDYEDGEVREPVLKIEIENNACQKREVEHFHHVECDDKKIHSAGQSGLDCFTLASVEQENKPECQDVKREHSVDSLTNNKSSEQVNEHFCLKELLVEEKNTRENLNKLMKTAGKSQLSHCEKRDALEHSDISSDKATKGIEEPLVTVSQCEVEKAETVDLVPNDDRALPNVIDDTTKDVSGGSRHTRIINLSQTSNSSPPSKTRTNFVRSVLARTNRELIPDVGLEEGKLQHQGRNDSYRGFPQKISANGHQNPSPRMNFTRRRGRITNRIDSLHGQWDFDPDFPPGVYNGQMDYGDPRHKYVSAVSDDDLDQTPYKITPNGPFRSGGRRGRQIIDDEGPLFCHIPSRRKSPSRRDAPPVRSVKMVHRIPRNISPNRCIGEDGSELVEQRHGEKFMRTFGDESMDPMYKRPHPPYEVDRPPFFRDRRNFSIQRKGFPRNDSKSPGRSSGRSPGQWFPPKRSDRFCGRPEISHRSSPSYGMEMMRSPDQPPMRGEMGVRRHGYPFMSPPSNDLRDMGSAPDHGHMRPTIPNRNQTDRLPFRNRRFDVMDHRDRIESNEYFDGPVHSGQLNELAGDVNNDDRRRFGDRHEPPLHSFRPPYNDPDGENFHNNGEDCPRPPFMFCAEDDSEFHERGNNLREREFERRVKNQPGPLPRRNRVMEEQHEVNYRHDRQLWNDHGFDDNISRVKRKRF